MHVAFFFTFVSEIETYVDSPECPIFTVRASSAGVVLSTHALITPGARLTRFRATPRIRRLRLPDRLATIFIAAKWARELLGHLNDVIDHRIDAWPVVLESGKLAYPPVALDFE